MRLAVVTVNWNGWEDTVACVRSLEAQTRRPEWVVVVDNASTNDSVARLRERCPGARLLESGANLGFAGGNNVGIRWALQRGADAVWLLNNDATAHADACAAIERALDEDQRVGVVGTPIYRADQRDRLQAWGGGWANLWTGRSAEFDQRVPDRRLDYVTGCSMALPRRALERSGLLDDAFFMYFEDTELCFRYRAAGWHLRVAEDAVVWHRGGASAVLSPRQLAWRNASLARFLRLHSPLFFPALAISAGLRATSMAARGQLAGAKAVVGDALRAMADVARAR
ncbi:MAG: glycosyltransferase family 2 protein [Deltaproteobacteria bacterium]|nr:glycosyltransferase family 2 protein [Deltaproteobacteria bacterium]